MAAPRERVPLDEARRTLAEAWYRYALKQARGWGQTRPWLRAEFRSAAAWAVVLAAESFDAARGSFQRHLDRQLLQCRGEVLKRERPRGGWRSSLRRKEAPPETYPLEHPDRPTTPLSAAAGPVEGAIAAELDERIKAKLTPRQRDWYELARAGHTPGAIARRMNVKREWVRQLRLAVQRKVFEELHGAEDDAGQSRPSCGEA
jgi:hypothetical protein